MATRYLNVFITVAFLLIACTVVAASGNAREHDPAGRLHAPKQLPELTELLEWHSGSAPARFAVSPQWNSSLKQLDTEDSVPLLRMHGAPGFQDLAQEDTPRPSGYSRIPIDFRDYAQRPIRHAR